MCFLCNNFQKPFLRFVSERLTVRCSSLLCFGCITIFCWNRRLNMRRSPSPIFLFNIINLCSVTMKSNTLKFYVLWTMHWHFVWHKIKKPIIKLSTRKGTRIWVCKGTRICMWNIFYKLHVQNKGKPAFMHKEVTFCSYILFVPLGACKTTLKT